MVEIETDKATFDVPCPVAGRLKEHKVGEGDKVKVGDVLVIHYRTRFLTVRVAMVPERILPSLKPAEMYEIVDERKDDARDWL